MLAFSFVATATLWMPTQRWQTSAVCSTDLVPYGTPLDLIARTGRSASCTVVGRSRALLVSPDVRARFGPGDGPIVVRVYAELERSDCTTAIAPATCCGPVVPCAATLPHSEGRATCD